MELQIFKNEQFGEVRTAEVNQEIYFNLKDCCQILGIKNSKDVVQRLNPKGVVTTDLLTNGGVQQANFINEANFYKLVFQSRKPEAEKFADWVTSEVLPSIRKNGAYMTDQTLEQALTSPDFLIQLANQLKQEKDRNLKLEAEEYFDELVDRNLLTSFRETAKQLKIKERKFIDFLLEKKYIYRDKKGKLQPAANKNDGLFEVKESLNEKTKWSGTQTLITPKGRETFRLLFI